jgi:hypothetical protein
MAQSLMIVPATRRTLVFRDSLYGLEVKARRLNNGKSGRKQYVVLIPKNPEGPAMTQIVERVAIKDAIAEGSITLSGREV